MYGLRRLRPHLVRALNERGSRARLLAHVVAHVGAHFAGDARRLMAQTLAPLVTPPPRQPLAPLVQREREPLRELLSLLHADVLDLGRLERFYCIGA